MLLKKVALVTGGDIGIGRAVSVHFAREGEDVAISYLIDYSATKGVITSFTRSLATKLTDKRLG